MVAPAAPEVRAAPAVSAVFSRSPEGAGASEVSEVSYPALAPTDLPASHTDEPSAPVPTPAPAMRASTTMLPRSALQALMRSPRRLAVIAGALVLGVIVVAFAATRRNTKPPAAVAAATPTARVASDPDRQAPAPSADPADEPPPETRDDGPVAATTADRPTDPEVAEPAPERAPEPEATPAEVASSEPVPPPTPRRTAPRIAGKQVVLEYDSQARDPARTPSSNARGDSAAIGKARRSYNAGNQRLFAGDPAGAIRAYQQALAIYPGYVAGYRGLGLAYAQQGDKPKALAALRTYVRIVPAAKDVPLIKKRIAGLQAR